MIEARERTTGVYEATFADADGAHPVLTGLWITLYNVNTGTKINGRDRQSALNDNNVEYDSETGALVWSWTADDMAIVGTEASSRWTDGHRIYTDQYVERHRVVFELQWPSGQHWHAEDIDVQSEAAIVEPEP